MLTFTAQQAMQVRLMATNRQVLQAGTEWFEPTAYDYVVRSVDDLPAPIGNDHFLSSGSWAFASPVDLGSRQLRVAAGETVYACGHGWQNITTSTGNVVRVDGVAVFDSMALIGTGSRCILLATTGDLWLSNCHLAATSRVVEVSGSCVRLWVTGGRWVAPNGVFVIGSITAAMGLFGLQAQHTTNFLQYNSGSVRACLVRGCEVDCATGIVWAAGNLPFEGLAVLGNHIDYSVAAYSGHTPASARANYKCNTDNSVGALITETAIVP